MEIWRLQVHAFKRGEVAYSDWRVTGGMVALDQCVTTRVPRGIVGWIHKRF